MRDFTEGKTRAKISRTQGNAPKHVTPHTTHRTIRAGEFTIKNNFNTKYWNVSNKAPLLGNVG